MLNNLLLMTDSYKVTHWRQYPPGTEEIYSYLEARKGGEYKDVVFFGLQYFLKRYFLGGLVQGNVVTQEKIEKAAAFFKEHFGNDKLFNRAGWEHILKHHGGRLPLEIKAVPEGTVVPEGNVMMTIENTDPECYWLTNYMETLLVELWYPCTVATISREMKKLIKAALVKSGTDTEENLEFKLHDFGFRGATSPESAAIGGAAHLVNFKGTDTLVACELIMDYYNSGMPGFSIPAAEHSTITSWGQENEGSSYLNMLQQFPTGPVAVVSDSWDIFNAVTNIWGKQLHDEVLNRDGVLIGRPDSGNPNEVLPKALGGFGGAFGLTLNNKGYEVLNPKVRVIQGDFVKRHTIGGMLDSVMNAGYSADNVAWGSGGGLIQDCNRDTQRFAMKCSEIKIDGEAHDVFKQPATDPTKNSKKGRLMLVNRDGEYQTVREGEFGCKDLLVTVFRNGRLLVDHTFEDVRQRAALK